jgi:uncharacterized Ntn-hydrolase superfamily protein
MTLPVSTYSIVARDSVTGEIGVAVQSHYFSVGPIVPWAEAGVGAVATQSLVDPSYGPLGLELMRAGRTASEALDALVSTDAGRESRQVAMIDAEGRVAVHTGKKAIAKAGHKVGAQYSVQANLMEKSTVWDAMADAFEESEGDLAERMLCALEAAEAEGGDIRGRQSAAIVIVRETSTGRPWADRLFDLRVEDHPRPVSELRRLVQLQRAYNHLGDVAAAAAEEPERVLAVASEISSLVPDKATNGEIPFWIGLDLLDAGHESDAIAYLHRAYGQDRRWAEVVVRLVPAGILPDDRPLIDRLVQGMKEKR